MYLKFTLAPTLHKWFFWLMVKLDTYTHQPERGDDGNQASSLHLIVTKIKASDYFFG